MSADINPQKTPSTLYRCNTVNSKIMQEPSSFADKMKEVKSIITALLPQDRQHEVLTHLDQLQEIYVTDVRKHTAKFDKNAQQAEEMRSRGKKSEKVILQVRDGKKVGTEVKIEGHTRLKSPEKKVEDKKFIKFQPKKVKGEVTPGLSNILKSSP